MAFDEESEKHCPGGQKRTKSLRFDSIRFDSVRFDLDTLKGGAGFGSSLAFWKNRRLEVTWGAILGRFWKNFGML